MRTQYVMNPYHVGPEAQERLRIRRLSKGIICSEDLLLRRDKMPLTKRDIIIYKLMEFDPIRAVHVIIEVEPVPPIDEVFRLAE